MDVEVVEVQTFLVWADCHEADPLSVDDDVAGVFGLERFEETGSRSFGRETTDSLKALLHRGDAEDDEGFGVLLSRGSQD